MPAFIIFLFLLLFAFDAQAAAQNAPIPKRKQLSLETIEQALAHKQKKEKSLKKEIAKDEQSLKSLQKNLVSITKRISRVEQQLFELEEEEKTLASQKKKQQKNLENRAQQNSALIATLVKVKQQPPEARLFSAENRENLAITQAALYSSLPRIGEKISNLQKELLEIDDLGQKIEQKRRSIEQKQAKLKEQKAHLSLMIAKRKKLFEEHKGLLALHSEQVKRIASRAKDMKELLTKLATHKPQIPAYMRPEKLLPKKGNKRLPIPGIIKVSYGQKDTINANSEGIHIQTRPYANAVAPMGGVIRYIGSFKGYKNLIIIEHQDNYHSLIAGLEQINVKLEQSVVAGEPIGVVGGGQNGKAALYYELRHKGQPINPL